MASAHAPEIFDIIDILLRVVVRAFPKDIGHRQLDAAAMGAVVARRVHPPTLLYDDLSD
jgi:hypothetical protein